MFGLGLRRLCAVVLCGKLRGPACLGYSNDFGSQPNCHARRLGPSSYCCVIVHYCSICVSGNLSSSKHRTLKSIIANRNRFRLLLQFARSSSWCRYLSNITRDISPAKTQPIVSLPSSYHPPPIPLRNL